MKTLIPPDPKLEKARYGLLLDAPFWGSLMVRLPLVADPSKKAFCTDGKVIRYNPECAEKLSIAESKYILCHEIAHCALGHLWRSLGKDMEVWNTACDYVVNGMLDKYERDCEAAKLPRPWSRPAWMFDIAKRPDFAGLSAEEIYGKLMKEKQPPPPPDPQPQPGAGSGQCDLGDGETQPGSPDPIAPPTPAKGKAGPGDFEAPALDPDPEPQPGQEAGAEGGLEGDWQIATAQAEQQARNRGNCPGTATELVTEMKKPKVSWREVLREFIRQRAKNDWSFARPNRRHLARGFILPSLHSEKMGRLVAAFDSSGSTVRFRADFQAEVQAALDECLPERLDVIVCDTKVNSVQKFEPGDVVQIEARGGGGTDFRPVFTHIETADQEDEPPVCMVFLTDLDGPFPAKAPDYPVLWCAVNSRGKAAPFGETIHVTNDS